MIQEMSRFTHFCRDAENVALLEPKKNVNLGLRAKKTEFAALVVGCNYLFSEKHVFVEHPSVQIARSDLDV